MVKSVGAGMAEHFSKFGGGLTSDIKWGGG